MTTEELKKKAAITGRMIREVSVYWADFGIPMPLRILSAKHSRELQKLGGFHAMMDALVADGSFTVERKRSGRTLIYPGEITQRAVG